MVLKLVWIASYSMGYYKLSNIILNFTDKSILLYLMKNWLKSPHQFGSSLKILHNFIMKVYCTIYEFRT